MVEGEIVGRRDIGEFEVEMPLGEPPSWTGFGKWTRVSWTKSRTLNLDEYERLLNTLRNRRNNVESELSTLLWWLGDVMIQGERDLGEDFFQIVDAAGYVKESLIKIRRTCEEFTASSRFPPHKVSFWTHWDVRKLSPQNREMLLSRYADDPDFSREDLRDQVRILLDAEDAQDELMEGAGVSTDTSGDDMPACPLCSGSGHVTNEERDAYLEGVIATDGASIMVDVVKG